MSQIFCNFKNTRQRDRQNKRERQSCVCVHVCEKETAYVLFFSMALDGVSVQLQTMNSCTPGPEWMIGTRAKVSSPSWESNPRSCSPYVFYFEMIRCWLSHF